VDGGAYIGSRVIPLPDRLGAARRALESVIEEAGWRGDRDFVLLAVQEALTNALRHGRGLRQASAEVGHDEVVVRIADFGERFDPSPYLRSAPPPLVERGRGLWMMGELTSVFGVSHEDEGNCVELRFRASAEHGQAPPHSGDVVRSLAESAHLLFDAIGAGVVVVDDRLLVCEANTPVLRLLGLAAEEVVGRDIRAVSAVAKDLFREPDEFVDRVLYLHAHPHEQADDLLVLATGGMIRRRSFPIRDDGTIIGRLDAYSQVGEESTAVAAMQRALLPRLPSWPGLDVGAIYHPATAGAFVGGDFYDFVELPGGGRCVVIGDVSGRGTAAAAASATVRAYLRSSLESAGVTSAFADVDRAVTRELADEEFVTLAVAMEESPGVWTALSCGHEPLLLVHDGEVRHLDPRGELLGLGLSESRVRAPFTLVPGDALLLYTDGVTDAGFGRDRFGIDRLRAALLEHVGRSAQDLVTAIDNRVHEFAGTRIRDDHALVALVVP
jgi:serine phosphatase RsbU (regulator of sigma subunit)/anti-sigma regulatory factor (Ser/Thr protein kinase)